MSCYHLCDNTEKHLIWSCPKDHQIYLDIIRSFTFEKCLQHSPEQALSASDFTKRRIIDKLYKRYKKVDVVFSTTISGCYSEWRPSKPIDFSP